MSSKLLIKLAFIFSLLIGFAAPASADTYSDFIHAVKMNSPGDVIGYLRKGMEPNTIDPTGQPVLQLAAFEGHQKVVEALVAGGANIDRKNKIGETAIMLAAFKGHKGIVEFLLKKEAQINHEGWTPLIYAATEGHVEIAKMLIDATVYIDQHAPSGMTALMMAARGGHEKMVTLLIEEGADPWVRNLRGNTAWMVAEQFKHTDIAQFLKRQPVKK
jgi:uncharacterized protein